MKTLQEELNRNKELMGLLVEQGGQLIRWFTKYLSREAAELASQRLTRLLGKSSSHVLDNIIDVTIKNTKNIGGIDYLISASGNKIKIKLISQLVDLTSQGLKHPDEWIKYLPRFTSDGSPYRHIMKQEMETLYKTATTTATNIPTRLLGKVEKWVNMGPTPTMFSGWKFHVFGETLEDAAIILERLEPVLKKWGVHWKVGNETMISKYLSQNPTAPSKQTGKLSTIYLNPNIIRAGMVDDLADDIMRGLGDYNKTGNIYGDKSVNGTLHYRYEFSKPIDVAQGVPDATMRDLYVPNRGIYNIEGNPDLFDISKLQ